jgi:ABC-type transporter Mla subunit MlaD
MTVKEILTKTRSWIQSRKLMRTDKYQPDLTDEGLISDNDLQQNKLPQNNQILVQTVQPVDKNQSLEKLQEGFNKLIGQLGTINTHLNEQVSQHKELMNRLEKLPSLLESFPEVVQSQKQLTQELFDQLKAVSLKEQQFVELVEKIPAETAKQSDCLINIDHQLAAAADIDVQMAESFNRFNKSLEKLDQTAISQTDGIMQMSKTFATSDRYFKYIISRQNKRFMWIFVTAITICAVTILIFAGIIIYLRS